MWTSLGYVTVVSGQPQQITINARLSGNELVHAIFFQQVRTNVGFLLIGEEVDFSEATGLGLLAVLPVPTINSLPNATVGIPDSGNPLNAKGYYIDGTNSGDKCLVSVLIL